jgi:hypothetical protein
MTRAAPTAGIDLRLREASRSRERFLIAFNKLRTPPSRLLAGESEFCPLPDMARDSSCLSVSRLASRNGRAEFCERSSPVLSAAP